MAVSTTGKYEVHNQPVEVVLAWLKGGEIAIPEIQRPFVWDAVKVRNLMDSLYQGYPIGYLIAWQSEKVRLKDGRGSAGRKILIDGQQRVTALAAAILGWQIVQSDYRKSRIRIAFHPLATACFSAALTFYRSKRGSGARVTGVSTFLKQTRLHKAFGVFWIGSRNPRQSHFRSAWATLDREMRTNDSQERLQRLPLQRSSRKLRVET